MEPIEAQRRSRSNGCECLLMALALYALLPGYASAGDQPPSPDSHFNADVQKAAHAQIAAPSFPAPFAFSASRADIPVFSPTEFRARRPGAFETTAAGRDYIIDAPMLRDTSLAHELSEAKTQDRVRLLTLWQSRASSLSLQAGRRGSPSLQWSTPWMRRGVSSRGLFDRLLPASPGNLVSTVRGAASRQAGASAPAKSLDLGTPVNNK